MVDLVLAAVACSAGVGVVARVDGVRSVAVAAEDSQGDLAAGVALAEQSKGRDFAAADAEAEIESNTEEVVVVAAAKEVDAAWEVGSRRTRGEADALHVALALALGLERVQRRNSERSRLEHQRRHQHRHQHRHLQQQRGREAASDLDPLQRKQWQLADAREGVVGVEGGAGVASARAANKTTRAPRLDAWRSLEAARPGRKQR